MTSPMFSRPNPGLDRSYVAEAHERKTPSPSTASPRLSRKVHNDLTDTEKSGIPLNTPWTMWLDRSIPRTTASEYEATLRKVYTCSTVESFWAVYNNIPEPCSLLIRYSYHLMRNETKPMWEDPVNKNGGVWKLKCHKWATNKVWKTLLLAVIGEQFSDNVGKGDDIMGVSVSIRENEDLIQIWSYNWELEPAATVLDKLKELLPDVTFPTVFYKPHQQHYAFEPRRHM
ncbi:eukaryotic translation initiation factor 4E type 3-like [Styela clava]